MTNVQVYDKISEPFAFDDEESGYSGGGKFWKATTLYEAAEEQGCKPYKLPLKYLDLSNGRFGDRLCDAVHHHNRVLAADTSIPVIVSPVGNLIDGYHRVVRAICDGDKYVMAYRLSKMPESDGDE